MKTILCSLALLWVVAAVAAVQAPVRFNNTICPVMGNAIKTTKKGNANFVVYNGVRYEVCCASCVAPFNKEPQKYLAQLPNKGVLVDLGNSVCPIRGGAVDKTSVVVYNGTKVHLCCPACAKEFLAAPEKYLAKAQQELKTAPSAAAATIAPNAPPDAKVHCPVGPSGGIKNAPAEPQQECTP